MASDDQDALVERLARLDTGQVSDVLDEAGLTNHSLSTEIRPLKAGGRFAGRATCVRGIRRSQGQHQPPALPGDAMEKAVSPGSILLIETGSFTGGAILGGFFASSLQRHGCRAIITDGAVRDADEIRELGIPCLARSVTPINGSRRWQLTEVDIPLALPGQNGSPVRVDPGDLVLGDADGVVIVPAYAAKQIIEDSEKLAEMEGAISAALRQGMERVDAFKANPRFSHIRAAPKRS